MSFGYHRKSKFYSNSSSWANIPANIYLFKFSNINTWKIYEICPKLTIKIPERRRVFIVNFEHTSQIFLVFLLLTLIMYLFVEMHQIKNLVSSFLHTILQYYLEVALQRCSKKRCSENMQEIYRRTPMRKCDFNKVA